MLQRVDKYRPVILIVGILCCQRLQLVGDIFLLPHEAHEHVLVRQFLLIALGDEAVEHVVVLHGGMTTDGLETAMVVREDQSVG